MFKNFIQVAGVIDFAEAEILMSENVMFLGFPLRLPVNKEDLSEEQAKEIISKIKPPFRSVLITYLNEAQEVIAFCEKMKTGIIQLHGSISVTELKKIKQLKPDLTIIKSLVIGEHSNNYLFEMIEQMSLYADAFITDTFNPVTKASGATGLIHDWNISKRICELSGKPVILAGGLNPENVYEAIKFVKPSGVDVHTGVENSSGRKSRELVKKFLSESKKAFTELNSIN
jgi:phosphoribosylanthranilate isomerase